MPVRLQNKKLSRSDALKNNGRGTEVVWLQLSGETITIRMIDDLDMIPPTVAVRELAQRLGIPFRCVKAPTLVPILGQRNDMTMYDQPVPFFVVPFQGKVRPGKYAAGSFHEVDHCRVCDDLVDHENQRCGCILRTRCAHCNLAYVCFWCMPGPDLMCWHCKRRNFPLEARETISPRDELLAAVHDSKEYDDTIHDGDEYDRLMNAYLPDRWCKFNIYRSPAQILHSGLLITMVYETDFGTDDTSTIFQRSLESSQENPYYQWLEFMSQMR